MNEALILLGVILWGEGLGFWFTLWFIHKVGGKICTLSTTITTWALLPPTVKVLRVPGPALAPHFCRLGRYSEICLLVHAVPYPGKCVVLELFCSLLWQANHRHINLGSGVQKLNF